METRIPQKQSELKQRVQHGGGGRCKEARSAVREQGRSKTGVASLPHVKLAPNSGPEPTGEGKEHLDAVVAFAGVGQRRRLFTVLDVLTVKWATRDLPEECQRGAHVLEERKGTYNKAVR